MKHNILTWTLFLALSAVLLVVFGEAAKAMLEAWQQDEYSHGPLVLLLGLLLLLNKIEDIKQPSQKSWAGVGIIAISIIALFLLQAAGIRGLHSQILVAAFVGLFITFYGLKIAQKAIGPVLLLFFAAPLPKFIYYTISFNMQLMSTTLGAMLLSALGISVYQEGNIIDLGGYQLQVVEACNGLRYLFPLMSFGFLLAYMYKASFTKRAILFLSTIPITIIMNVLRIVMIGITVDQWGQEMAEGMIHDIEGWMVFAGCAIILALEIKLMQHIGRKGEFDFDAMRLPKLKKIPAPQFGKPAILAALCLFLGTVANTTLPALQPDYLKSIPLKQPLSMFPLTLGEWTGRQASLTPEALAVLGTNEYHLADYKKEGEPSVNLYMLYFPKQDGSSNQAIHTPAICIPAGGWEIISSTVVINTLANGKELPVNRVLIKKGMAQKIVYYWFVQNGEAIANVNTSKLLQIKNAMLYGKTNAAMIRLVTTIKSNEPLAAAEQRLSNFIDNAWNVIPPYLFLM